ncbi:hypothetical protein EST38_g11870 [Candolleomyces aberdarensis]|uniref:Uncharacterized protein n=1 Tax=Candolleomyces aberdarensis TaxID=2316362 RepID=A0A4Q2D639_9AGAR|nr:hypothetical protein EST38_g11870 [Candolleomyces aberdarensis]
MATQYPRYAIVQNRSVFLKLCFAEALEDAGIRHCVVGDVVAWLLGSDVVLFDTFVLVADEQLDAARNVMLSKGFREVLEPDPYFSKPSAKKNPDGWPGYRFAESHHAPDDHVGIKLVPASFWKFDLGQEALSSNTVVLPGRRFRFPVPLYYVRGRLRSLSSGLPETLIHILLYAQVLIALLVELFGSPSAEDENSKPIAYINLTYGYLIAHIPDDLISQLSPEDQLFVKFFIISPIPTRKKVYAKWDQVRQGIITKEEAERYIERDVHMKLKRKRALERRESGGEMQ